MKIIKNRISKSFDFNFTLNSNDGQTHSKMTDKEVDVDLIISSHLDALKIKLQEYLNTIPDKQ